jgi:hypothetical protein
MLNISDKESAISRESPTDFVMTTEWVGFSLFVAKSLCNRIPAMQRIGGTGTKPDAPI